MKSLVLLRQFPYKPALAIALSIEPKPHPSTGTHLLSARVIRAFVRIVVNQMSIAKIQTMLLQIRPSLRLIPNKHYLIVSTI